jgi:hypothetical protein
MNWYRQWRIRGIEDHLAVLYAREKGLSLVCRANGSIPCEYIDRLIDTREKIAFCEHQIARLKGHA